MKEEPTFDSGPSSAPLCLDIHDANLILRSSDQVNFRVHKSVLASSSPFFKDLLSLPQSPDNELIDGLPVVQVPENADLLRSLVSFLYPISPVKPCSYKKVFALLAACQKYDMVSTQSYIREKVECGSFFDIDRCEAFTAYGIASSMGLDPEMKDAARLTIGLPMSFEFLGEELRSFKGSALRDLFLYRAEHSGWGVRSPSKLQLIARGRGWGRGRGQQRAGGQGGGVEWSRGRKRDEDLKQSFSPSFNFLCVSELTDSDCNRYFRS